MAAEAPPHRCDRGRWQRRVQRAPGQVDVRDHSIVIERTEAALPAGRIDGAAPALVAGLFVRVAVQVVKRGKHDVAAPARLLGVALDVLARGSQLVDAQQADR